MDEKIFKLNLLKTIKELEDKEKFTCTEYVFKINTIEEKGKPLSSRDETMSLTIFYEKRINKRFFELDEVVSAFTALKPLVPLWINVIFLEASDGVAKFRLDCSKRFRQPSLLHNQETGHPPFKAILVNESN